MSRTKTSRTDSWTKLELEARHCTAHTTAGRPCGRWAVSGGTVCPTHGGRSPQVRRAAERRIAESKAMAAVETLGLPANTSPTVALLDELARTAGHVQWLAVLVGELPEEAIVWNRFSEEHTVAIGEGNDRVDYTSTVMQARPAVWLQLYQQERAHLVRVCKVAIKCGIAEREIRLAEAQGALIARIFGAVFSDAELGLSADQQETARTVASKHLRTLRSDS